ncbi:hypothetical protein, partial [Bacillus sp. WP8]|uniref:hypothetical protein n=1 Tax=Bacillus sp. WP8 TaxID=756828 RepID=UPI0021B516E6
NPYVLAPLGLPAAVLLPLKNKHHLKKSPTIFPSQQNLPEKPPHPHPVHIQGNNIVHQAAITSLHYFNQPTQYFEKKPFSNIKTLFFFSSYIQHHPQS